MSIESKLLYFLGNLVLPLAVGCALARRGRGRRETLRRLMMGNLLLLSPLVIAINFWGNRVTLASFWLPVLGAAMQLLPGLVAWPLARWKFDDPHEQGGYILATVFANRSITGILSVYILFGEEGFAYGRLAMLFGPFLFYLVGFPLAAWFRRRAEAADGELAARPTLWGVLFTRNQMPLLGVVVGILLERAGPARPEFCGTVFPLLVALNAWGFLLPVGYDLDFGQMRRYWTRVADLLPLRFLVIPAALYGLCRLTGLEGTRLGAVVVLSFAPSAIGAVIAAKINRLDVHLPMAAYLLTTGVYLLVVFPLMLLAAAG